jgi:hypothetical protein
VVNFVVAEFGVHREGDDLANRESPSYPGTRHHMGEVPDPRPGADDRAFVDLGGLVFLVLPAFARHNIDFS